MSRKRRLERRREIGKREVKKGERRRGRDCYRRMMYENTAQNEEHQWRRIDDSLASMRKPSHLRVVADGDGRLEM